MKEKYPMTMAIRFLQSRNIEFEPKLYKYQEKGGTSNSSKELNVDEYSVIKTIIMEDNNKEPFIVLMHGNKSISEKQLARIIGVKSVSPCLPAVADKHSGYTVGGTSPFGTKRKMKVYIESTILNLEKIHINGGKKGFLVVINPKVLLECLDYQLVEVAC